MKTNESGKGFATLMLLAIIGLVLIVILIDRDQNAKQAAAKQVAETDPAPATPYWSASHETKVKWAAHACRTWTREHAMWGVSKFLGESEFTDRHVIRRNHAVILITFEDTLSNSRTVGCEFDLMDKTPELLEGREIR